MYDVCNVKGHVFEICGRVYITILIDGNIVECYVGRETASARLQERDLPVNLSGNSNLFTYGLLMRLGSIRCSSGARKHSETPLDVVLICSHWLRASPSR